MSQKLLLSYKRAIDCPIEVLAEEILCLAERVSQQPQIRYRIKDADTLAKKMILKSAKSIFDIHDVYGFRVLTLSTEEAYAVQHKLIEAFGASIGHDYIAKPKTRPDKPHLDGKSLRLLQVIAYRNRVSFEIQITTFSFNEMNESLHDEYHREKYANLEGGDI